MAHTTAILSLGTRKDATTWENGCAGLGFNAPFPIKKPAPSLDDLRAFFKSQPHWIFLAGHFGGVTLFNDAHHKNRGTDEVSIVFRNDRVTIQHDRETADLEKKAGDFNLHKTCRLVVWGGCNVFEDVNTLRTMRALFGEHVLLGFDGITGWKVVDALLGAGFIKTGHFFERVKGHEDDPDKIRDAWMLAAKKGYGGGKMEEIFRALDPNGREWKLQKGAVVRGRRIT